MRIIRFSSGGRVHYGQPAGDGSALVIDRDADLFTGHFPTGERLAVERVLAPIVPIDILCIGLNYRAHAAESGSRVPANPMLFIKASTSLLDPFEPIRLPRRSTQVDYEAELAVVIGRECRDVRREDALSHVFGYTAANDVTARDWQRDPDLGGGQFARGKSFDTFCPLGPEIVTADEIADPNDLPIRCTINGETVQEASTSDMIFDVPALIESLSSTMTLMPGTTILTGTPSGVGMGRTPPRWLAAGDEVVVTVGPIAPLVNRVEAARPGT